MSFLDRASIFGDEDWESMNGHESDQLTDGFHIQDVCCVIQPDNRLHGCPDKRETELWSISIG
ncbi:hypothetical protein PROFUN_16765 [Planoprotostelium fungivorum]|uniref:Uncharacterized protein n=1 Tax=Planoprotostelium fungivorum TaxID=1890364 RepID=A0A2P6MPI7_9EUKA|nr:hypothetical protein PROFUN_16765 [Planoprotostelium fungivorum]